MSYASDHSKAVITPHEKIAELFKQRDDARRALVAAETNLAKLYAQREDAQAEMSEMVKQLSDAWEEIERMKTPAVLHAHCVRYMTEAQIAHIFGERMTKIVNELAEAREALNAAATSLCTISQQAGRTEELRGLSQVRLYAFSRYTAALDAAKEKP